MKNLEDTINNLKNAIANPSRIRLDQLDPNTLNQLLTIVDQLIQPKEEKSETKD